MTTAINETCIGGLYENYNLVNVIFLKKEMSIFLSSRSDSTPNLQGFPKKFWVKGKAVRIWWIEQARLTEGAIFGEMGDAGGIIQGDHSAGQCFALRDLIPMSFFKQVVIMKLKMCTT